MCGRYTQSAALDLIMERLAITIEEGENEEIIARYNVAPSQSVPVVVQSDGRRKLIMARWGFRPIWIRGTTHTPINARAETVATSPMFKGAFKHGRCLVPATGFYEWKAVAGQRQKQPYYLRRKGGALFTFAGLWASGCESRPPTRSTWS